MATIARSRSSWLSAALAAAFIAVCAALVLLPGTVHAHAYLAGSSPAPSEELDEAPDQIELRFTEAIAPAFSDISVLDQSGQRVDRGGATVPRDDLMLMRLPLPPLPEGTYTVTWRNVSAVDGHSQRGWYVFSIGGPIDPDAGLDLTPPVLTTPFDPPVRWIALIGAVVLAGGIVFDRAIARPALARVREHAAGRSLRAAHAQWSRRIVLGGLALWAAGTLLHLPVQLSVAMGEPIYRADLESLRALLLDTTWGQAWLARAVLLALAAALVPRWLRGQSGTLPLAVVVLGALFTHSAASHGGALVALRPAGITTDFVHLAAAAVWTGGLAGLVVLIREARATLTPEETRAFFGSLLPRFSVLGVLSVGALIASGAFLAWMHVHDGGALNTPYGRTLLIKVGLFALMVAIAATNLLWTTRAATRDEPGGRWMSRLVAVESGLAVLVILAVAGMTSMEPARSAAEVRDGARTFETRVDDVEATLRLEPGRLGTNRFEVLLEDRRGDAIEARDVRFRLTYLDTDIGDVTLDTTAVEVGRFAADGALLGVAGMWRIEVTAARVDGFDVRAPFLFEVGAGGATGGPPLPIDTARSLWLALWIGLAALFHTTALRLRRRHSTATSALQWSGSAFVVLALLVITNTSPFRLEQPIPSANPLPASSDVLARGQEIYQQRCVTCHGTEGYGDGPAAIEGGFAGDRLALVIHVPLHTDREVYGYITSGIPGTPMLAFEDTLSEDDVWSVLHYIRGLARTEASGSADELETTKP